MSILQIRTFPDPILRSKAKPVMEINDDIKNLTSDMIETLLEAKGLGLAANQVGILKRIIVLNFPEKQPMALINPEIMKKIGKREVEEGCLSIPGYRGTVKRSERVRARALDLNGKVIKIKAEGLLAQALEHETDHLNGYLYIDRLVSRETFWKITYNTDGNSEYLQVNVEKATESSGA